MSQVNAPVTVAARKHNECPQISDLLENCPCMWQQKVSRVGMLTAYATRSGLVVFLDFKHGGWTMLTECPSNTVGANATELGRMIEGKTQMKRAVDAWNSKHGNAQVQVRCWPGAREGDGVIAWTTTLATVLGGHTAGVYIGGVGFVALSHVEPIDDVTDVSA